MSSSAVRIDAPTPSDSPGSAAIQRDVLAIFTAKTARTFCYGFLGVLLGGGLKIVYDLLLYRTFKDVRVDRE